MTARQIRTKTQRSGKLKLGFAAAAMFVVFGSQAASAAPVSFSSAVASYNQTFSCGAPPTCTAAQMIDGVTAGFNGWAVSTNDGLSAVPSSALLTLTAPLSAGTYVLTFTILQNYGTTHTLGDFSLGYTTVASPTLASANTALTILSASSTDPLTTFLIRPPGELLVGGTSPLTAGYTIVTSLSSASPITGIFLGALSDPSLPGPAKGPGRQPINGNFVVSEVILDARLASTVPEPASLMLFATGLMALVVWKTVRSPKGHGSIPR